MIGVAAAVLAVASIAGIIAVERATRPFVRPHEPRLALAARWDVRLHLAAATLLVVSSWVVLGGVAGAAAVRVVVASEVTAGRCP